MTGDIRRSLRRCAIALLPVGMLGMAAITPEANAQTERVVIALTVPTAETNRFWGGTAMWDSLGQALQGLVDNDPETGVYSDTALAESWEANEDFTEWTFYLRQGVQFHYGYGEVTSEDVLHSYELHAGEDSRSSTVGLLRGATVTAPDRYTVKFAFETPQPEFLFLHGNRGEMFVYSKAQFDQEGLEGYDRRFAATGHYQFVEASPGRKLYRRVEDHYSGATPDFEELELRFVAEGSTRLAMLLTGEAHIAELSRELQKEAIAAGMETATSKNPAMQTVLHFNGLYCMTGDEACRPDVPWHDVRIREAMNRALDREAMLQVLFEGRAARVSPWYGMREGHEGYDPTIVERFEEMYGYDPERAKELLAEAGYPDKFAEPVVPIVVTAIPGQPEIPVQAELVQQYFNAIGLQTEIREIDFAALRALGAAREAYVINPLRNAPIRPTETHLRTVYHPDGSPYEGFETDEIMAYIEQLGSTRDPEQRDVIARETFNYLFDNYAVIPLFEVYTEAAYNPEVVAGWTFPGVTTSGMGHWHLIEAAR